MSGLFAFTSASMVATDERGLLLDAINLAGTLEVHTHEIDDCLLSTTYLRNAPLNNHRTFDNERWAVLFSGDLIHRCEIPYTSIVESLESGQYGFFSELEGIFSIVAYSKIEKILFGISDSRSQKPLYYCIDQHRVCLATHLSVFNRLFDEAQFDKTWLWQYLFFNYPVTEVSFLKGVTRMPPASVIVVNCVTRKFRLNSYADSFTRKTSLLSGMDGLRYARDVFADRVPRYYEGSEEVACALTGGWDGRTMLALAPSDQNITSYTYGSPGCGDLAGGSQTAIELGVDHVPIHFDESFVNEIPQYALETVYLSSGLQGILRSTLHYMYKSLTQGGARFPLTISGIALDMQFRGHAHRPNLISEGLARLFEGQEAGLDSIYWRSVVGENFGAFEQTIDTSLEALNAKYGDFKDSFHHLSYIVYQLSPKHFCGEMAISDNFTTVRVPTWDSEIIKLAYSIEQSTLTYSQFLASHKRGSREEMVLQAYLFKELAPGYFKIPIGGRRPSDVLAGDFRYQAFRYFHGLLRRLKNPLAVSAPLEDWPVWLFEKNSEFLRGLLDSGDTQIMQYIEKSFIQQQINNRNTQMIGKFATAEIILRLINNRWRRFW